LRIQDWDITVKALSDKQFKENEYPDGQAYNRIVRLLNTSEISLNKDCTENWYQSLIHELVHLMFDHIEQAGINACNLTSGGISKCIDDNYTVAMERTVDRVADIISKIYPLERLESEAK
jgi:hypothetical protein